MYTRRTPPRAAEDPGQDSFLDIVANLVGILIILVMVVAVRAREAIVAEQVIESQDEAMESDVETPRLAIKAVTSDIHQMDKSLARQKFEVAFRRRERDKVLAMVTQVEKELAGQRQQLTDQQQKEFDIRSQVTASMSTLEKLQGERQALDGKSVPQKIIEHFPTPMVKTVFGREIHFQLKGGRLAYIPWDTLVSQLQADAPRHVWKLKDASRISQMLGPVEGFRMKYTLVNKQNAINTRQGSVLQRRVELENFELRPISPDLGESVAVALKPGSRFLEMITLQDQDRGTVTVWVYPDSFRQFRDIRGYLYKHGYNCASRPLPAGHPIGGSPDGTRSLAQ